MEIVLFLSSQIGFFRTPAKLGTRIGLFCACDGADEISCAKQLIKGELIEIGQGVRISKRPIPFDRIDTDGNHIYASLSHTGYFAGCYTGKCPKRVSQPGRNPRKRSSVLVQITHLQKRKSALLEVEDDTLVGFYDKKCIFLTYNQPLREAAVHSLVERPHISTLETINGSSKAHPWADVTRLNVTRVLFYRTPVYVACSFNVDTRENARPFAKKVYTFPSTTGIDPLAQCVFQECGNGDMLFSLGLGGRLVADSRTNTHSWAAYFIPPDPEDPTAEVATKIFNDSAVYLNTPTRSMIVRPIRYDGYLSLVRVFQDVFLMHDPDERRWYLVRLVV